MSGDYVRAEVLVAVVLVAAVFAGVTTAATGGSIAASPNDPNTTATHTASVVVDGNAVGGSWTSFQVEYQATDVSNVGQNDVVKIGIDRDNDAPGDTIDVDVSDDLSSAGADNNGHTLDVGLGGNYGLQQNDELVVVYENAQNPRAGDYDVALHVNYQSADETDTATLSISADTTTTQTATATATATQTATATATSTQTATATPTATTTDFGGSDTTTTSDGSDGGDDTSDIVSWASVNADPAEPSMNATHTTIATVDNETARDSWNGLVVNYSGTGTNVSGVGQGDVVKIGIDRGGDAGNDTVDVNVSDDLSSVDASNDGETLTVGLGGNYDLQYGDEVVVVYENVQNPSEGIYQVPLDVNHQSSGGTGTASLVLLTNDQTTETATPNTETVTETSESPTSPTTTAESTPSTSPGFGTIAAVVALAAAALLARR
ncbi:PGF-CTERM sorting domain-containing protein [Halobacterium sp. KA-4]|uniref:PGF-CTERM sorting domain-containing protein n=1 Tax=Halobacterium sp. KA-4 TaxID=2896367 RepID=UPI001E51109C|nr:PGF-CTERM sorting domain-containing protein [Halobacterium sp. KA-4]MCD2198301.1 PGF-CTERM sorting domain-containing protein [Halobacterium sp. KA-4]